MKMHEASFGTAHREVNDANEVTSAWAELLNKDGGEDENEGIHPKTGKRKPQ